MSELAGWIVAAYLAGALAIAMAASGRWHRDELLGLATWPIAVSLGLLLRKIRRLRSTCRICGTRYGSPRYLALHKRKRHEAA